MEHFLVAIQFLKMIQLLIKLYEEANKLWRSLIADDENSNSRLKFYYEGEKN